MKFEAPPNTPPTESFEQFSNQDPYKVLGLPDSSNVETLNNRKKELLRKFHPDVNKDPRALDATQRINAAFDKIKTGKFQQQPEPSQNRNTPPPSPQNQESEKSKLFKLARELLLGKDYKPFLLNSLMAGPVALGAFFSPIMSKHGLNYQDMMEIISIDPDVQKILNAQFGFNNQSKNTPPPSAGQYRNTPPPPKSEHSSSHPTPPPVPPKEESFRGTESDLEKRMREANERLEKSAREATERIEKRAKEARERMAKYNK